jgi:hypothetical protein
MSDFIGMKQPSVEAWAKWRGLLSEQLESGQSVAFRIIWVLAHFW